MIMKQGRHLDLGCGRKPRNPYGYTNLAGVDLYQHPELPGDVEFRQANLTISPIPFDDNQFDAISAFDFIEHIPRILSDGKEGTRFPFIELMNEVWRVLKPGGTFYALTPAYPHPEVFQDPTHVNIITDRTHEYFSGHKRYAMNYGFNGDFAVLRAEWIHTKNASTAEKSLRKMMRSGFRTLFKERKSHFLWELEAIK